MKSSYKEEDVVILLKDITGMIKPLSASEREKKIQQGIHYSEMLPVEYRPTEKYIETYNEALKANSMITAKAVVELSKKIWNKKNGHVVLVSLARAGTPIGILVKKYLEKLYKCKIPHYSISIIRDKGIDHNAMKYILKRHKSQEIQFVDGWIGKGAIAKQLKKSMQDYNDVSDELAVLADPARITDLYGTREDFLIPSSCLNAPVSGLFSRTVLNDAIINRNEFHGAVYYEEMKELDVSYEFINEIEKIFYIIKDEKKDVHSFKFTGAEEVEEIAREFKINNINYIKPGIGETTRVLLRRIPWKILVKDKKDIEHIGHILRLCKEKNVEVVEYPLINYRSCGIIKQLSDI